MDLTIDDIFTELKQANLSDYALKKKDASLFLLYSDSRIDETKLNPIFDRYPPLFEITYFFPLYPKYLQECGFTPEFLGPTVWKVVTEEDGTLVTIKLQCSVA